MMGPEKYRGRTVDTNTQEMNLPGQIAPVAVEYPLKKKKVIVKG